MRLSPQTIEKMSNEFDLISPFQHSYVHEETNLSGGLSCAGYDVHLASLSTPTFNGEPLSLDENMQKHIQLRSRFIIPPNGIVLGSTVEKFNIPKHLSMDYFNKSTLARRFIDSAATLAEPSWHGHLTLEIKNNSHVPQTLVIGQPIGQVVFQQLDHPTEYPYNGKYQGQSSDPKSAE